MTMHKATRYGKETNKCTQMCESILYYKHIFLLHVSAALVAILSEVHQKQWIYHDIKKVCESICSCKIL